MSLRSALKEQYHGGLAMLADCVRNCPEPLWISGIPPRTFWRIAFHDVYFTHLYLGQNEDDYQPWPRRPAGYHEELWRKPWYIEPYELPADATPLTRDQVLDYIEYVDSIIDSTIDRLDLETSESGFHWYPKIGKLSHQLMNLRHLQGHVGQLSELLMAAGVDIDWRSM